METTGGNGSVSVMDWLLTYVVCLPLHLCGPEWPRAVRLLGLALFAPWVFTVGLATAPVFAALLLLAACAEAAQTGL